MALAWRGRSLSPRPHSLANVCDTTAYPANYARPSVPPACCPCARRQVVWWWCPGSSSIRGVPACGRPQRLYLLRLQAMDSGDSGEGPPSGGAERGGPGSEAGAGSSSGAPGGEAGEPLTLGAGVLSRMRQLRALDEYRQLMEQLAEVELRQQQQQPGPSGGRGGSGSSSGASGSSSSAQAAASLSSSPASCSELLLQGALLIARHRYPELDEAEVRGVLDDMARKVSRRQRRGLGLVGPAVT